jgi:predicted RecB family nuclease
MKITSRIFEAFLKCPTKCYLRLLGETGSGNEYAEWVCAQSEAYEREAARRLQETVPEVERVVASPTAEKLKAAKWQLAINLVAQLPDRSADSHVREFPSNEKPCGLNGPRSGLVLESRLHAVERIPSEGRGKAAQFIPIRFIYRNKLTKDDRLLLAFDAFALSEMLGREVSLGKIIHGDSHTTLKVKTSALSGEVRKRIEKIAALLSARSADSHVRESPPGEETRGLGGPRSDPRSVPAPPDLVLNRHCAECEFRDRCRKIAIEKDDLSLLAGMSAKERQKLRSKGIFTVTQLSYTFRPRRRPKRLRDKREKYHHALKALAIREKKTHIVGSPELKIEGTPVYLDVEGLPDRDFYYLIGLRIGNGDAAVRHSLWADTAADEGKIWREFLAILESVEKPVLVHYGSYETTFLARMSERYGEPMEDNHVRETIGRPLNLLSVVFGQIYFPTYSNGLKEISSSLGFSWANRGVAGTTAVVWRFQWESSKQESVKQQLIHYNASDCAVLELLVAKLNRLQQRTQMIASPDFCDVVYSDSLRPDTAYSLGKREFALSEFEHANKAAYWDYQRDRIYVRSREYLNLRPRLRHANSSNHRYMNKTVVCSDQSACPRCGSENCSGRRCSRILYDLRFGELSVKRWLVEYRFRVYRCPNCRHRFGVPKEFWPHSKYGRNLVAYLVYCSIHLYIPLVTVKATLRRFFNLDVPQGTLFPLKQSAAKYYTETYESVLKHLVKGNLLHADETLVSIKGKPAYVWVFTNLHEVAYVYAESREGEMIHRLLTDFKGVLVSDFYTAYDSLACRQQKCLVHLMRDLNEEILNHPYDEELKLIVKDFAELLRVIVETVDRRGLKRHFLWEAFRGC